MSKENFISYTKRILKSNRAFVFIIIQIFTSTGNNVTLISNCPVLAGDIQSRNVFRLIMCT